MFFYERSRNKMANVIDGLEAWGCNVPEAMNRFLQDEGGCMSNVFILLRMTPALKAWMRLSEARIINRLLKKRIR